MDLFNERVHLPKANILEVRVDDVDIKIRRCVPNTGKHFVEVSSIAAHEGSLYLWMLLAVTTRLCLRTSFVEAHSVDIRMKARRLLQ